MAKKSKGTKGMDCRRFKYVMVKLPGSRRRIKAKRCADFA